MEANTYYDQNGRLQVNPPLEQSLVELASWRMSGRMDYTLEPVGKKPIAEDSIVAKNVLAHYIQIEKMHKKFKKMRTEAAIYWTTVYFTWVIANTKKRFEIKEETEVESKNILRSTDYDEIKEYCYEFTGKVVPLREFRLDENSLESNEIQDADKCVMKETMSLDKFKLNFDEEVFNGVDDIESGMMDWDPAYWSTKHSPDKEVVLHYYFNKVTQDYWIIANECKVIFAGKMTNKNWELPFTHKQHYTDHKNFYGYGICHKVRYLKAYKAEMLQDILDQSKMWWFGVIAWNSEELNGSYIHNPAEINIMRFSWDVQNIKTYDFNPDINKYYNILALLDDMVIQDTWENLKGTYTAVANQLGTVEIIENSRMTRLATVDENDDHFLCDTLTHILENITQYASVMQTKTTTNEEWVKEIEYPMITVKNAKVIQDKEWTRIIKDMWEEWYFEFRQEMIKWRYNVKVITNSNMNTQKALEKNSVTQYINNFVMLANLQPEIIQQEDITGILELLKMIYWYDDKFMIETTRDQYKREALEMIQEIQQSLGLTNNNIPNEQLPGQDPNLLQNPTPAPMQTERIDWWELAVESEMPDPRWATRWALI